MAELLNIVLVEVLKVALVAAMALFVPLLVKLLQKAGVQLDLERQEQVNRAALFVAAEVEEWAAGRIKANLNVTSGEKLERAVEGLVSKIPGVTEAEAKNAIRAALPQIGLGAAAGLRELGKALKG